MVDTYALTLSVCVTLCGCGVRVLDITEVWVHVVIWTVLRYGAYSVLCYMDSTAVWVHIMYWTVLGYGCI